MNRILSVYAPFSFGPAAFKANDGMVNVAIKNNAVNKLNILVNCLEVKASDL